MRVKESSTKELTKEFRDMPPEVIKTLVEFVRTVKRVLEVEKAKVQPEKIVKRYKERAASLDFGLAPDADYAEELIEIYQSTFPHRPIEAGYKFAGETGI